MSKKIELLCIDTDGTLTDGSLIYGNLNSSLGASFALAENFERSQTISLVSRPKFSANTKSPPQILELDSSKSESNESSLRGESMDSPKQSNQNNSASAHRISPDSWCKKSESKGAVVPPADFLLESELRGSPPKSEKAAAFWRVGGTGRGVQPFLRKETSESSAKSVDCFGDESPRNDESFLNCHDSPKSLQDEFAEIAKVFNVKDGLALAYWRKTLNRKVAIITGRSSEILRARAKELGIDELLFMGIRDKGKKVRELKERFALDSSQIATIGDDLNDIPMFKESLCNFAPSDCAEAMKTLPHTTILKAKGGKGAVREAIEIILKKESLYEAFVSQFV